MSRPRLQTLKSQIPTLHKSAAGGWGAEGRGSSAKRGYGYAWRKLREQILVRDGGLCVPCRSVGLVTLVSMDGKTTPNGAVDHILNKARGGTDHPANLRTICNDCHDQKTQAESRGEDWAGPTRRSP